MTVSAIRPQTEATDFLDKNVPVHFVGIGGIGMSGLAKILCEAGFQVSGSDLSTNPQTEKILALGGKIFQGHATNNVPEKAILVVSTAIDNRNPEIMIATERGQAIVHRSAVLREVLHGKALGHQTTVGIAGTHGKTTMTGMTGLALRAAKLDPTIVVGGLIPELGTNAVLSSDRKFAVAELDESDGSIVQYHTDVTVIANLELDHAEHYPGGLDEIIQTFHMYLKNLKSGSRVLFNITCPQTKTLMDDFVAANPEHIKPILVAPSDIFTGNEPYTTYWLKNVRHHGHGGYQGYVYKQKRMLGELHLAIPGLHNLTNGLFAVAVGDQLGADFDAMTDVLREFSGMGRRFERVGEFNQVKLFDDYAHHPSELQATLKAARDMIKGTSGRLIVTFQPHRYTRLRALWEDFSKSFADADEVFITDVYAAHEEPIEGLLAEDLAAAIQKQNPQQAVHYVASANHDFSALKIAIQKIAQPGDVVMSLGAGSITKLLRNWG